jgi:putative peptide modification system cyclase
MDAVASDPTPVDPTRSTPQLRAVLVCDLADSTALVERLGDSVAADLMRRHDRVARDLLHAHGGREIDKTDGFLVLFERAVQAVAFALAYQRALRTLGEQCRQTLRSRIGIHVGEVVLWDNTATDIADGAKPVEVEGLAKPVAARLMGLALPGQILMTDIARSLAQRARDELPGSAQLSWRDHGSYRFKGVPVPLSVHEVGEIGSSPLTAPPSSAKAQRGVPFWRRPIALAIEAVALIAALTVPIVLSLRAEPAIAFAERDWVVLGDLRNLTSEKLFDDALDEAFRIGLEQSRYVNVLPGPQTRDALRRMQREPDAVLDREVAIELALREGARAVLLPTVTEFGNRIRISAEVVDPNSGATVYAESADGESTDDVLTAMDEVIGNLRARLGESLKSIEQASAPLGKITTTSLDALRAFALAEQSFAEGNIRQTLSLLEQAIALDPEFAMAYGRLATIRHAMGDPALAYRLAQDALKRPEKLSARERLMLDGTVSFFAQPGETVERWQALLRVYPGVAVAENNSGLGTLWFQNDPRGAAPHFQRFVEFQPPHHLRVFGWFGLAVSQVGVEDADGARRSMEQAAAFGVRTPAFEHIFPALQQRDYATALKELDTNAGSWGATTQIERALRLAAVQLDQGDPARARGTLDGALAAADPAVARSARSRIELGIATLAVETSAADAATQVGDFVREQLAYLPTAIAQFDHSALLQLSIGIGLAERIGEHAMAASALASLREAMAGRALLHVERLLAPIDCVVADAPPAEEIACLRSRIDGFEYVLTHALLMERLALHGEAAAAATEAQWLVQHRGRALVEFQKYETQLVNIGALNRAELVLIESPPDPADRASIDARIKTLSLAWADAPPGSPWVARLRSREQQLLGEQDH